MVADTVVGQVQLGQTLCCEKKLSESLNRQESGDPLTRCCLSASASALAPSTPMLLLERLSSVRPFVEKVNSASEQTEGRRSSHLVLFEYISKCSCAVVADVVIGKAQFRQILY